MIPDDEIFEIEFFPRKKETTGDYIKNLQGIIFDLFDYKYSICFKNHIFETAEWEFYSRENQDVTFNLTVNFTTRQAFMWKEPWSKCNYFTGYATSVFSAGIFPDELSLKAEVTRLIEVLKILQGRK